MWGLTMVLNETGEVVRREEVQVQVGGIWNVEYGIWNMEYQNRQDQPFM